MIPHKRLELQEPVHNLWNDTLGENVQQKK